jgi:hypothetical protein
MSKFRKHVCAGDCVESEWNGLTLRAELLQDQFVTPDDYDCYSDEHIEAWERDEWFFGGLIVSLLCGDSVIAENLSSLWGLDCNIVDDNTYLDEVAGELFEEAKPEAKTVVANLLGKLSASCRMVCEGGEV